MEVSARAKQVRVSPRKVRLVLETLPGKRVNDVLNTLRFLPSAPGTSRSRQVAAANARTTSRSRGAA
jgi:large subunit ribosomal protein L22